jgi:WD40 repeat protein
MFAFLITSFALAQLPESNPINRATTNGAATTAPPITALIFAPGGKSIIAGSQAGIEVRSFPDLKPLRKLETKLAHVHDLAFSPDRRTLAAAGGSPGESGELDRFSWPEGKLLSHNSPHEDLIYRVAWFPNKEHAVYELATVSADHSVLLHKTVPAGTPTRLASHSRPVLAVAVLPGGEALVSAGVDQSLRVWDVASGRLVRTLDNHTAAVHDLALRPGESDGPPLVASAGADRTVRLWQPTIGRLVRFARLPSTPLALAWTKDGRRLVTSCADGHGRVLDPETIQVVADLPALDGWGYSVALSPDSRHAVVGGPQGVIRSLELPPN